MPIHVTIRRQHLSIPAGPTFALPDFCVITGPNGSGKSQLLAAIAAAANSSTTSLTIDGISGQIRVESASPGSNLSLGGGIHLDSVRNEVLQLWKYSQEPKRQKDPAREALIAATATRAGKPTTDLTEEDFWAHTAPRNDAPRSVFDRNIAQIFMRYYAAQERNDRAEFLARKYPETPQAWVEPAKFVERYGPPPWETVNAALLAAGLRYSVNHPLPTPDPNPLFAVQFTGDTGVPIGSASLSSGERTLLALSLALYNAESSSDAFPHLLLLDEPDAPLHPGMTVQFLKVVRSAFLDRRVAVVMTTHSPSTVALVPDDSLFRMNPVTRRPEKVSKDEALATLTAGVPTLSIVYDNRRQVWVESTYDAASYEHLYRQLRNAGGVEAAPSLTFIGTGSKTDGGCSQVMKYTRELREGGNGFVLGLVDWDLDPKRTTGDGVVVLGQGKRYSIENYVFDPLLLATFLLREKDEGLARAFPRVTSVSIESEPVAVLQAIVDHVVNIVRLEVKDTTNDAPCKLEYCGDNTPTLRAPHWYLNTRGHDLENAIVRSFPALNAHVRENDPARLTSTILRTVVDDHPRFIPRDVLVAFRACMTG